MGSIKRDVYVLMNAYVEPIEVTEGTDVIPIEFTVRDYNIPVTAAAVAYSLGAGMSEPNKILCDVMNNVISFTPTDGFFKAGKNVLQIRVINDGKALISFKEIVRCQGKLRFGDEEEAEQQTLVEQLIANVGLVNSRVDNLILESTTVLKGYKIIEMNAVSPVVMNVDGVYEFGCDFTSAEIPVTTNEREVNILYAGACLMYSEDIDVDYTQKWFTERYNIETAIYRNTDAQYEIRMVGYVNAEEMKPYACCRLVLAYKEDVSIPELEDIRIGVEGEVYETAGTAVREQIKKAMTYLGGAVTEEQIETAVNKYLDENGIEAGATEEQLAQIELNKKALEEKSQVQMGTLGDLKFLPILKIHQFTQEEYEKELESGMIDENALYLTPEGEYVTLEGLSEAINDALAKAKESGEFDGDDGVGIQSIEQTTTSSEDGGSNVITVTLTNGKKETFTVKNGSKGSTGEVDYSRLDDYGKKTSIIIDATSGEKSVTLTADNSNTEFRYVYASGITSLTLTSSGTFANTVEAFYSVVFKSGTTAITITNTLDAYFTGDDCVDGVFTPVATKTYEIGIWWNGLSWQAVVRGA